MTFETVKKLGVTVLVLFLLISFWSNPAGSADAFGDFVGEVGGFVVTDSVAEAVDHIEQVVRGTASAGR